MRLTPVPMPRAAPSDGLGGSDPAGAGQNPFGAPGRHQPDRLGRPHASTVGACAGGRTVRNRQGSVGAILGRTRRHPRHAGAQAPRLLRSRKQHRRRVPSRWLRLRPLYPGRNGVAGTGAAAAGSSRSAPFPRNRRLSQRLTLAKSKAARLLATAEPFTEAVQKGGTTLYRARFSGFDKDKAEAACKFLKRNDVDCLAMKI